MEASPAKVIQYFNGEKQNLIPLFQRPYTWKATNWQTLWDDVMVQYDLGDTSTHFMGAIVSVPARSVPVGGVCDAKVTCRSGGDFELQII